MLDQIKLAITGMLLFLAASHAHAFTITYSATDKADSVSGQDLWQYDYQVSGDLTQFESFELFFDSALFKDLVVINELNPTNWSTFVVQPEPTLPADGVFYALVTTDLLGIKDSFSIQFIWRGVGFPSGQPFNTYDSSFGISGIGITEPTSAVPVPGALMLFTSGFALLFRPKCLKSNSRPRVIAL